MNEVKSVGSNSRPREPHVQKQGSSELQVGKPWEFGIAKASCEILEPRKRDRGIEEVEREHILKFHTWSTTMYGLGDKKYIEQI